MTYTFLVVPGEIDLIRELGPKAIENQMPFDIQLITKRGNIPAERKQFPEDFLASVQDGRFNRECAAMREVSQHRIVIKEGHGNFDRAGFLWQGNRLTKWTRKTIRNLLRSLEYVEGVHIEETEDVRDTAERLEELQLYFDTEHKSLETRPGFQSNWLKATYEERYVYFLQGFPGISIKRAEAMAREWPTPQALFCGHCRDGMFEPSFLEELPRFGKGTTVRMREFWKGGNE